MGKKRSRVDQSRMRLLIQSNYSMGHVSRHTSFVSHAERITKPQPVPKTIGFIRPTEDYKLEQDDPANKDPKGIRLVYDVELGRHVREVYDKRQLRPDGKGFVKDPLPRKMVEKKIVEMGKLRGQWIAEYTEVVLLNTRFKKLWMYFCGTKVFFVSEEVFPEYIKTRRTKIYNESRSRALQRLKDKEVDWRHTHRTPISS